MVIQTPRNIFNQPFQQRPVAHYWTMSLLKKKMKEASKQQTIRFETLHGGGNGL